MILIRIILIIFYLLSFSLKAESIHSIERIDLQNYPTVSIVIKESTSHPINNEIIHLTEILGKEKNKIPNINIIRSTESRPVRFILSIQTTDVEDRNLLSRQIATLLIQALDENDKIGLHLFHKDTEYLNLNMDKSSFLERIEKIRAGQGNNVSKSLKFLFNQIKIDDSIPTLLLVISYDEDSEKENSFRALTLKSKEYKIPINILGKDVPSLKNISQYSLGEFYNLEKATDISNFQSHLVLFKKQPPIIEYTTTFNQLENFVNKANVKVKLTIGKNQMMDIYSLSITEYIQNQLLKYSELIFSISLSVLGLCVLIIININQRMRKKEIEERIKLLERNKKADLYYLENRKDSIRLETRKPRTVIYEEKEEVKEKSDDDLSESIPDYLENEGEKYEQAVLIIKIGANPGRQFNITKHLITIGNSASCDLMLWDEDMYATHAKIKIYDNKYVIHDMSIRGTYLNNKKILKPKVLKDMDMIQLGKTVLIFRGKQVDY